MSSYRENRALRASENKRRRLCLLFVVALAALAGPPRAGAKPAAGSTPKPAGLTDRDWKRYAAIVDLSQPASADVYALGDIHGDYDRLVELLSAANLIPAPPARPEAVKWSAGTALLVCTGDMIDKYDHSIAVVTLMRALQPEAEKAGGRVIVTLGNHEANFLAAAGEDKKIEFEGELKAAGISPAEVKEGRDSAGIGAWLRTLPAGAKVGEWFFCHAGNTGGKSLGDLRNELQAQVTEQGFSAPILSDPNSMIEARMHPRPWWDAGDDPVLRDIEKGKPDATAGSASRQRLEAVVRPLGVKHLVIGHQPGKVTFADGKTRAAGQMFMNYDGLLFMIDTGMSRGVDGGRGALLRISPGPAGARPAVTALYADGEAAKLWE